MHCLAYVLVSIGLLLTFPGQAASDGHDDSTDLLLTFGRPIVSDTTPYPYHRSVAAWYDTFLKIALQRKAWPVDAYAEEADFAPVFEQLMAAYPDMPVAEIGDDQWASPFLMKGKELFQQADDLRSNSKAQEAIQYYMRAVNVFRLAYFPWVHERSSPSKVKLSAWGLDKSAFRAALDLMDRFHMFEAEAPLSGVATGGKQPGVPLRVFRSKGQRGAQPVVVIITGLDHYYTYMLDQVTALTSYGLSVIVVPMPGTADSPVTGGDPLAQQAYWTSIVDWIHSHKRLFRARCLSFWGISTGSYWAVRASRAEQHRLRRVVSQGTASHYTFTRTWLEAAEALAYPASLQRALGQAFGYSDTEVFKDEVEKFSLLRQGVLDQPGAPLLAVNGEQDTIFPIDEQRILAEHGPGAQLRWFPHMGHNGEPSSSEWLLDYWKQHSAC